MDGPMAWWYFFGGGIAIVTSIILAWWCFLDAFRHRGSINRFTWPLIAFTGTILQVPAFTVTSPVQRASSVGTAAAIAGVAGFTLVGMSCVAYFSKSSGGGTTWFTRTRDNDSFLSGARERRPGASSARASVAVGGGRGQRTPTPVDFSTDTAPRHQPLSGPPLSVGQAQIAPPVTAQPNGQVTLGGPSVMDVNADKTIVADDTLQDGLGSSTQTGATVVEEGASADGRTVVAEDDSSRGSMETVAEGVTVVAEEATATPATHNDQTVVAESEESLRPAELTLAEEYDAAPGSGASGSLSAVNTIMNDGETEITLAEDPTFTTVVDEPEGSGGRLVITDGRSSRIVITERTGPFIVGRDPAKANLAVDDPKVSRAHFSISRVDEEYVISDLDSANGTFVNGEMLRQGRLLQDGDTVEFGRTIAKFIIDGGAADE